MDGDEGLGGPDDSKLGCRLITGVLWGLELPQNRLISFSQTRGSAYNRGFTVLVCISMYLFQQQFNITFRPNSIIGVNSPRGSRHLYLRTNELTLSSLALACPQASSSGTKELTAGSWGGPTLWETNRLILGRHGCAGALSPVTDCLPDKEVPKLQIEK